VKRILIIILILLLGIGVLSYPMVSNYLSERNSSKVIQKYEDSVAAYDEDLLDTAWAEAEAYNESLSGQPVHDPFLEGSGMAIPEDYANILNVEGIMGYVKIPKISVDLPIYHGTGEDVLKKGVGHLEGSTLPIGGESRHSVLTGHSGLVHARLFTDLIELKQGDLFFVYVLGKTLAYEVDQIKVVEPQTTEDLGRIEGQDYCTLLTCTPYGVNSHRLLVRGVRVDYAPEMEKAATPITSRLNNKVILAAVITSTVMLVLIVIALVRSKKRSEHL